MDTHHPIIISSRPGVKKIRKRRELDALISNSMSRKKNEHRVNLNANYRDKLLSTDEPDEYYRSPLSQNTGRCPRNMFFVICGPLLPVTGVVFLIGLICWIYIDLRQQIYAYNLKIEEVSASNQNLPDTLQKWHETSTYLRRNQTLIYLKISELQRTVDILCKNFTTYRIFFDNQLNDVKNEKLVADIGAKIVAIAIDIENMKDHYNKVSNEVTILRSDIMSNFSDMKNRESENNILPSNYLDEMKGYILNFTSDLNNMKLGLNTINSTFNQKSIKLQDEFMSQKTKFDELYDRSENTISHVNSIESNWLSYKQKIVDLDKQSTRVEIEIEKLKSRSQKVEYSLQGVCNMCKGSYIKEIQNVYRNQASNQTSLDPKQLLNASLLISN